MKTTILQLLADVKAGNLTKLNLGDSNEVFEDIPEEVYDLTSLEELNLGPNKIKQISGKIGRLNKLKVFDAGESDFDKFPLELMQVDSLTKVFIGSPKLKELPKQLDDWGTLTYLNLRGSENLERVIGLPPSLGYLFVAGGTFSKLPEKIFSLNKLTKLVAHKMGLEQLPEQLFEMVSILALYVIDTRIQSLPDKIDKLKDLVDLNLTDNEFKEFPEAITNAIKVSDLSLAGNYLQQIPSSLLKLKSSLKKIDLGRNNFTEIPTVLYEMNNLEEIQFGNFPHHGKFKPLNKIKTIPDELLKLKQLKTLSLYRNPIENIPDEILEKGVDAIRNYLRSKAEADTEDFLYEAKMVMVGRGNVGKTVLTKRLTNPDYALSASKTTHGISVLKNPFLLPTKVGGVAHDFRFNIWDFGGQEKYDATHQVFITNRSVYLFLTEAREESNYLDFYYWLNTIRLFSSNSPVVAVLSKSDERRKLLPVSVYKEKFDNIVDFVDVSCAKGWEYTIQNLKNAIHGAIQLLPQTKQKFSNHWIDIRNALEKLSLTKEYIDYEEYLGVCKKQKLDKVQADFLSQFLNDLGVIIHRQHDLLLKKTVFIKTDWCVDGMYKVLDDKLVFEKNGKFTDKDLSRIWRGKRFRNKQAELLKLMKEYNLCFELRDGSGYIAPDMLPPDKPNDLKWDASNNLQFEVQYDFMPAGMVSRFIVKSHGFIKDNLFWKHGVMLEYDQTQALVEEDYIHGKIKISLRGDNKKGLLSAIRMYIDEVHKDFDKANKLIFEEMVPCNCAECLHNIAPHFYKFNVLKKFEQKSIPVVPCEKSSEPVKIKSLINDVQISNPAYNLDTNEDLNNYVSGLIETVLENEISLKGGYLNFWRDSGCSVPKNEVEFQPYIANTLDSYCKVRGIQLSREVHEANGSVDILFSYTNVDQKVLKVCVEIKKADHNDIETAIKTQLPEYMKSAGTDSGIYLVIWLKNKKFIKPAKYKSESALVDAIGKNNIPPNNILIKVVNCCKRVSPSKH